MLAALTSFLPAAAGAYSAVQKGRSAAQQSALEAQLKQAEREEKQRAALLQEALLNENIKHRRAQTGELERKATIPELPSNLRGFGSNLEDARARYLEFQRDRERVLQGERTSGHRARTDHSFSRWGNRGGGGSVNSEGEFEPGIAPGNARQQYMSNRNRALGILSQLAPGAHAGAARTMIQGMGLGEYVSDADIAQAVSAAPSRGNTAVRQGEPRSPEDRGARREITRQTGEPINDFQRWIVDELVSGATVEQLESQIDESYRGEFNRFLQGRGTRLRPTRDTQ